MRRTEAYMPKGYRSTFKVKKENGREEKVNDRDYGNINELPLIGTLALVPQVVDALRKEESAKVPLLPVIAAGGIMDGRGIAACLALGAQGVHLGTRFLVANESGAISSYKKLLLNARETDTVITRAFTGMPARCIKNEFAEEFDKSQVYPLPWPIQDMVADDIYSATKKVDNYQYAPTYAGQGLRLFGKEKPRTLMEKQQEKNTNQRLQSAKEIMEELVRETICTIRNLTGHISKA